jgi:hypothetical protein
MVTDVLWMVTNIYPMVTNVYLMVAEESSVANPHKVAKIDEKIRKMQKRWVGNTAFADELPYSSVLSVKFIEWVVMGAIDLLSGTIVGIGVVPDKLSVTDSKVSIGNLMTPVTGSRVSIELYCHRSPSVPGLVLAQRSLEGSPQAERM